MSNLFRIGIDRIKGRIYFPNCSFSSRFNILPDGFLGSLSEIKIFFGHLNPARRSLQ